MDFCVPAPTLGYGRLASALLKGLGLLVLGVIALGVVATIVGIVAAIVRLLVTVAVLALVVLAVAGLYSLVRGNDAGDPDDWRTAADGDRLRRPEDEDSDWRERVPGFGGGDATAASDPKERLREQYVSGEISEAEFERKLERIVETESLEDELGDPTRDRLRER